MGALLETGHPGWWAIVTDVGLLLFAMAASE